jgi:CDP-diacylglycerol--serine O-phosphatidyltransferase
MFRPRFRPRQPPRIAGLSFNKMIPNILTLLALCAGLTAIRYGLQQKWEPAVTSIFIAGILDGLDGRIARLLHGTSKFGAELDSLAEFVSFGVAPSILLYLWTMESAGGFGWALVLLFPVCCALRLARFNTMIGQPNLPSWAYNFFTGVPAPAAAALALFPMIASFQFGRGFFDSPPVVAMFLVGVSFLMVSTIPTFSFKRFRVPMGYVLPLLVVVGLLAAFLVTEPWATIAVILVVYLAGIPVSIHRFTRLKKAAVHSGDGGEPAAEH